MMQNLTFVTLIFGFAAVSAVAIAEGRLLRKMAICNNTQRLIRWHRWSQRLLWISAPVFATGFVAGALELFPDFMFRVAACGYGMVLVSTVLLIGIGIRNSFPVQIFSETKGAAGTLVKSTGMVIRAILGFLFNCFAIGGKLLTHGFLSSKNDCGEAEPMARKSGFFFNSSSGRFDDGMDPFGIYPYEKDDPD